MKHTRFIMSGASGSVSAAVEPAILYGLGYVRGRDGRRGRKIGDGARDLEHAMIAARRQAETADRLFEQLRAPGIRRTVTVDFACAQAGVGLALALLLPFAGCTHARAYDCGRFALLPAREIVLRHGRHFDLQVDAVEQRPGDFAAVARDLIRRAAAAAVVMPEKPQGQGGVALLPNVPITLKALKPKETAFEPQTIGEHIKKRRLQLRLTQKAVSRLLKVSQFSVINWERGEFQPSKAATLHRIIKFLGYDLLPVGRTIPERLRQERRLMGWDQRELAKHFGVDRCTVTG